MMLDPTVCYHAVRVRDRHCDGRFFVGNRATGVYCRPVCAARAAKRANMQFYPSAAAAEAAGHRPCGRCRPECAPGIAPDDAAAQLVAALLAMLPEQAGADSGTAALARAMGMSAQRLARVTKVQLGASPEQVVQTQRLLLAKRLLHDTRLSATQVARAAGFTNVRRFTSLVRARYGVTPRSLRGTARRAPDDAVRCRLDFRPPLAWDRLLAYLAMRAIPGVEAVTDGHYRRTAAVGGHAGWIAVSMHASGTALNLDVAPALAPVIGTLLERVRRLCDLGAVPQAVSARLGRDPTLAAIVRRLPGLRVPGAFDGFELAVRAVLGQQVSVRAATTMAGRWAAAHGTPIVTPHPGLVRLAPSAAHIARIEPGEIAQLGIIGSRATCIVALARAVAEGTVTLAPGRDVDAQIEALQRLPGIGAWTAHYIAMRALNWPDAFPGTDLMLLRAAKLGKKELAARAEAWRPWRAYATHYLWQSLGLTA